MSKASVAAALRKFRLRDSLTAEDVGRYVGRSGKTVNGWEHGIGQPDADALIALCRLYNVGFDAFSDEGEDASKYSDMALRVASAYDSAIPEIQTATRGLLGIEGDT